MPPLHIQDINHELKMPSLHMKSTISFHGEITPCQVEHRVRTKFATPILHAIYDF